MDGRRKWVGKGWGGAGTYAGRGGVREWKLVISWGKCQRPGLEDGLLSPMEATLAKMIVLKHMDSEVANYYSQWRDNDSKPPRKPSTKNVFYLQGMQGQIQSRDSRPDQPMTDII